MNSYDLAGDAEKLLVIAGRVDCFENLEAIGLRVLTVFIVDCKTDPWKRKLVILLRIQRQLELKEVKLDIKQQLLRYGAVIDHSTEGTRLCGRINVRRYKAVT
jgi:hypothetical protein